MVEKFVLKKRGVKYKVRRMDVMYNKRIQTLNFSLVLSNGNG